MECSVFDFGLHCYPIVEMERAIFYDSASLARNYFCILQLFSKPVC